MVDMPKLFDKWLKEKQNDIKSLKYNDMEIAYSTKVQKELVRQIKVGNWLLLFLVLAFFVLSLMLALIWFGTGIIGNYLARAVC